MARASQANSYFKNWRKKPLKQRIVQGGVALAGIFGLGVFLWLTYAVLVLIPMLPGVEALTDYRPKVPLRVFTSDNVLIGEFGEERRNFVPIAEIPAVMKKAVIAIEDSEFYEHGGVDFSGIVRAGLANLKESRSQGASTITMQVARNFLLTRKKTYTRKLHEVLLAFKIESALSKDQILELYMNQIYLGERAYGFGSAANVYFGKTLQQVTIAEAAMLAGLPKAPSSSNPIVNPKRAAERQQYILKRMRDLSFITPAQYAQASAEKLTVRRAGQRYETHAEHAAELVRQLMYEQYKDEIYSSGMSVYTTLVQADQDAAYEAVRRGVLDYERRHGYRGPEAHIELPKDKEARQQAIDDILLKHPSSGELKSAVVVSASTKSVSAILLSGEAVTIAADGLRFAAPALSPKAATSKKIRPGSVIRVMQDARKKWAITQVPEVAAAFIALNAGDGSVRAMVGGFDFALNQFDHVTQAWRQPGSTIKPFIYSAALEKGYWPGAMIEDSPLPNLVSDNGKAWNPGNDDGIYEGPITMRTGLKKSRNLVSIRLLQSIGPSYARDFITRFGFEAERHPANLTMTLGTGAVTPMQMAGAYAVFANGGYQIAPYLIAKVVDARGNVISAADPVASGDEQARVLDPRNAFIIDSMMRDVVRSGTGYAAGQKLGRRDLAGKTGTTNDAMDGWFAGYGSNIVGVAWMGYDKPKSLGSREFGGTLALPIWTDYMRAALRGKPESNPPMPAGLAQVSNDYLYQEYVGNVVVQPQPQPGGGNFWERLFGSPPPSRRPNVDEEEQKRYQEMYGG